MAVAGVVVVAYAIRGPLIRDGAIMNSTGNDQIAAWSTKNFPLMSGLQPLVLLDVSGSRQDTVEIDEASAWMRTHFTGGLVLTSALANDPFIFRSRLPTDAFIFEGAKPYWTDEMKAPGTWSNWIVVQPQAAGDAVALKVLPLIRRSPNFTLAFENSRYQIYEVGGQSAALPAPVCRDPQLAQLKLAGDQKLSGAGPFDVAVEFTNGGDQPAKAVLLGFAVTRGGQYVSRADFGNGQPWLVGGEPGGTLYSVGNVAPKETEHISLRVTPTASRAGSAPDAQVVIEARFADLSCPGNSGEPMRVTITH